MDWEQRLWQHGFERVAPRRRPRSSQRHPRGGVTPRLRKLALTTIVLGSIGGGALVGAAFMAFLSPTSGGELRRKLLDALAALDGEDEDELADYDSGQFALDEGGTRVHRRSEYADGTEASEEEERTALGP